MERQAMVDADPVNPMRIVWGLSQRIPENAIVTADSGSAANWCARYLRMRVSLSGTLATIVHGVISGGTVCDVIAIQSLT
jgi:pyruvate dehydrogenase (quinone)